MYNLHHPVGLNLQLDQPHDKSLKDLEAHIQRFNERMAGTGSKLRAAFRDPPGWFTVYFELQDGHESSWCEQHKYACRTPAESLVRFDSDALDAIIKTMRRGYLYALADGTHADPSIKYASYGE